MKTKILILIAALLVSFATINSFGIANQKHAFHLNYPVAPSPVDHEIPVHQMDWVVSWTGDSSQSDHAREFHNFHFDRFDKNRRRMMLVFGIKLLLSLLHVSIFLCTCIHLLH